MSSSSGKKKVKENLGGRGLRHKGLVKPLSGDSKVGKRSVGARCNLDKLAFVFVFAFVFLTLAGVGGSIMSLVINDATDTISIQHNRTENSNSTAGVRLDAPVLFMDFDKGWEGNYTQDNSIENNYGTMSGTEGGYWIEGVRGKYQIIENYLNKIESNTIIW